MKANLIERLSLNAEDYCGDLEDGGESGLFGTAFLPEKWLEENEFSPFTFYAGRVNLAEFSILPNLSEGFLYFFVEAKNFNFDNLKAIVRYYNGEIGAYTDFNEGFFDDEETERRSFKIVPSENGDETVFFSSGDETVLLSIKGEYLPFEINGKRLEFTVKNSNLAACDFSKCLVKIK